MFEEDVILTVDLAVYEVANSVWKHEYLLKDLRDGLRYLSIFRGLLETNKIRAIHPNQRLIERSYEVGARNDLPIYDAVFIALALEIGAELKTFDREHAEIMRTESAR